MRNILTKGFLTMLEPKTGKSSPSVRVLYCNRSGVVELVGREPFPLTFARVENGVTKFWPKELNRKKFRSETAASIGAFSFILGRRGKTIKCS